MNAADQNTVRVKIYGHEYTVKAVANGQYIQDVAAYVDARMKETELNLTGAISATRIAILAAMSITDELMLERKKRAGSLDNIENQALAIAEMVDEALESSF